ncbi:MAG: hypothetical protein M3161_05920 [Actinomycetota bacterium]|nr:hypothetical protein [Actinomycetota bacterium]
MERRDDEARPQMDPDPAPDEDPRAKDDEQIEEESEDSFPASDPPAW